MRYLGLGGFCLFAIIERIVAQGDNQAVFDYISDVSNNHLWQRNIDSCIWTSTAPIGLDSTYEQQGHFMGKRLLSSFKITKFEQGQLIQATSDSGPVSLTITREVMRVAPQKVVIKATLQADPGRFFGVFTPLLQRAATQAAKRDYTQLKSILDARFQQRLKTKRLQTT